MSATYSGDPSLSHNDAVRFHIQDVDTASPLLQDEEIAYLLAENTSVYAAAAEACENLAVKFARQPGSRAIGGLTITYADLTTRYRTLAKALRTRAQRKSPPLPYLGGLSLADKSMNDMNTDHTPRDFISDDQWVNHNSTSGPGFDGTNTAPHGET